MKWINSLLSPQHQPPKLDFTILEKAEAATKSELAKKLRPLKGFYTLEMAPPRMAEMDVSI